MGFLITVTIIVSLLALILFLRVSVRIKVEDGMNIVVGAGVIRYRLFPSKEKKISLKDYKIKRFRKKYLSKETEKDLADTEENRKPYKKAKKKSESPEDEKEKTPLPELIEKILGVVKVFIARFGKHLRITLKKLVVIVASPDAASTALIYGATIGAVQNLYAILVSTGTLKTGRSSELYVGTDFACEKPTVMVDLTLSFRVWQLFDMALRSAIQYLKKQD